MRADHASANPLIPIRLPSRIGRLSDRTLWLSFLLSISVHTVAAIGVGHYFVMPSYHTSIPIEIGGEVLEMEIGAAYSVAELRVRPLPDIPESRFAANRPDPDAESLLAKSQTEGVFNAGELDADKTEPQPDEYVDTENTLGERLPHDRPRDTPLPEIRDTALDSLTELPAHIPVPIPLPPEERFEEVAAPEPTEPDARPQLEDALLAAAVLPDPGHWLVTSQLPVAEGKPVQTAAPRRPAAAASPPPSAPLIASEPLPALKAASPPPADPAKAEIRFKSFQPATRSRQQMVRPQVDPAVLAAVLADYLPMLGLAVEQPLEPGAAVALTKRKSVEFDINARGLPEINRPDATTPLNRFGLPVSRWSGGAVLGLRAPATVIGYFHPVYPASSRQRGEQGVVTVAVKINIRGRADEVRLARSSGFRALDEAAMQAARRAAYQPEIIGGLPVTAVERFDMTFRIQ